MALFLAPFTALSYFVPSDIPSIYSKTSSYANLKFNLITQQGITMHPNNKQKNDKVVSLRNYEVNISSVGNELSAVNRELSQILISLKSLEDYNDIVNDYEFSSIRRRIDTVCARTYRAEQISRGLKVYKA